jgi:hypothetical protein
MARLTPVVTSSAASLDISGNVDIDGITNLDVVDIDGAVQIDAALTVGVDDTGYDVKFFGATGGKYMLWNQATDTLDVVGSIEFDSLSGTGAVAITDIKDEDNMASDSATALATQQSIKAYVDAQVGTVDTLAEILANGNTTGGTDIVVSVDDVISMDNGTNLLPSLTTTGDLNTGLYFPAADEVGLTVGGTQRLNVSATGIDVTGTATMGGLTVDTSATGGFKVEDRGAEGAGVKVTAYQGTTNSNVRQLDVDAYQLTVSTGSVTGTTVTDRLLIADNGDISFFDTDGSTASFVYDASAGLTINEAGADRDFRVESDTNTHMLFVDAGNDQVIIGSSSSLNPSDAGLYARDGLIVGNFSGSGNGLTVYRGSGLNTNINHDSTKAYLTTSGIPLHFRTTLDTNFKISMETDGVVINEGGIDADFRVESDGNPNMLFVDGGNNRVGVGVGAPEAVLHIEARANGSGIGFYVDTNTRAGGETYFYLGRDVAPNLTIDTSENITFNGSTVFNEASADVDFRVESDTNTHALFVQGSNSKIGFGKSDPAANIDILGNKFVVTNSGQALDGILVRSSSSAALNEYGGAISFATSSTGAASAIAAVNTGASDSDSNGLAFFTHPSGTGSADAVEKMRLTETGLLGLGTTSPIGNFNINGGTGDTATQDAIQTFTRTSSTGNVLAVKLRFDNFDTNHADLKFQVKTTASSGESDSYYTDALTLGGVTGSFTTTPAAGGHAVFNEGGIDADFRVETSGNANMLFVDAGNNYIVIGSATANANDSAFFDTNGILSIARTSGIGRTMIDFRNAGASVGGVSTSTSATQYNTSSDVRLKENIADANDAGSKIDAIQVRQYDWKADGSHQDYGMVAQELQAVAPEAVTGDADSDEMMGVDYSKLVPMMLKEIQSLRARINALEAE